MNEELNAEVLQGVWGCCRVCKRRVGRSGIITQRVLAVPSICLMLLLGGCGGGGSQSVPQTRVVLPTITVMPTTYNFGSVGVGDTSATESVTVSATGGSASVTAVTVQPSNAPFLVSKLAQLPVAVESTQPLTFLVSFSPTASGAASCTLTVTSNASNSPVTISLSGTGTAAVGLTPSTTNLNFGDVSTGATSSPQSLKLTASGKSLTINSITAPAPFEVATVTLPVTLSANQSQTVQVSFAPTARGAASGTLTVTSTASNSPNLISLAGTGTSTSTSSVCVGSAISQVPADVTSELTSVGAGITVTQATSLTGNGAGSWNTYADLPTYSAPAKVVIYNYGTNPNAVASANLDGTNAQVISGDAQGTEAEVTLDGKFAFYEGQNPNDTADIYAVPLTQSGNCVQNRLSNLNLTPISPAGALIISNASPDSTGHNIIAFSDGLVVHRVYDDGTLLTPDPITLPDLENTDVIHRMRLNPKFPNILWYKRDAPSPTPTGMPSRRFGSST